jgi:hypothetical protein
MPMADLTKFVEALQSTLGTSLPSILGALAVLVAGWLVAIAVRVGIHRALVAVRLDERVRSSAGSTIQLEQGISSAAYYVLLVLVGVAFFDTLKLPLVSGPLQGLVGQVFDYLPHLGAGAALLCVAWIVATIARNVLVRGLDASGLDERLVAEGGMKPVSGSLGDVVYWLVILLLMPGVLGALRLQGMLGPVQAMVNDILGMLPNVFAAAVIGAVGWGVALIVRNLVTNLLAGTGADRMGESAGLHGTMPLSRLVGLVLYVLVLVPALVAALNALKIEAITTPATEMLNGVMRAIPNVFAAAVILLIAYLASRLVASLLSEVLGGMGFDRLPARLGIKQAFTGEATPSRVAGEVLVFFVMLFASVEAANRLGFVRMADLVSDFIQFGGQVLLGSAMMVVGFWLSNLAHEAIIRIYGSTALAIANVARFAILGLVIAMGLRQMGLAQDIVNLAFGLTLGAVAVAVALSFGLGGREAAGRQMEHWFSRLRGEGLPPATRSGRAA